MNPNSNSIASNRYLVREYLNNVINQIARSIDYTAYPAVLDLGCGSKRYATYFSSSKMYIGIDTKSSEAVDIMSAGEYLPFKNSTFNVVLCTQMLEHAENPLDVLKEIYGVLAPGGLLILSTHGIWSEEHEPKDFWRWTYQGLAKIINSAGFEITKHFSMKPSASLVQFVQLYTPGGSFSKFVISPFLNTVGEKISAKVLQNKEPNLYIVHIIIAKKSFKQNS
jgi:SAM-dependent methyltransferase